MSQQIIFTHDTTGELARLISAAAPDRLAFLTDETTQKLCLPLVSEKNVGEETAQITIAPTDVAKTLDSVVAVWQELQKASATRHSLLVNLGGGMVTDLGGFAASTYKRGIRFINIPTTLLSMVDAAVGGKTGFNFGGLKNEIGVFSDADAVIIDTTFLRTLDAENLSSGYAEMLKHALLSDEGMWADHLRFDLAEPDFDVLQTLVEKSVRVKERIVTEDPHERGLRKALNLGHTVGHALESLHLERNQPVLHGYAVAWGLIGELFLSVALRQFPVDKMRQTVQFIARHYGIPAITCADYDRLYALMLHDKKNVGTTINFTLLRNIGDIALDCHCTKELIFEMFDFLREGGK